MAAGSCEFRQLLWSVFQSSCGLADSLAWHIAPLMLLGTVPVSLALFILGQARLLIVLGTGPG